MIQLTSTPKVRPRKPSLFTPSTQPSISSVPLPNHYLIVLEKNITREYKAKPREVILEISQWINERECIKLALDNTLEEIDDLYDINPGSLSIPILQESIPAKETSIVEFTDKIGKVLLW